MRAITVLLCLITACGGSKQESAHMKRARELLSIGEWANARTELKLELKDHPRHNDARGLLLYCLDRTDGVGSPENGIGNVVDLYGLVVSVTDPTWEKAPPDTRDFINKMLISTRQGLYDQGVDTKDPADLRDVIKVAARFGFDKGSDADGKEGYAAILAAAGDTKAGQFLVDRLKGKNPDTIVGYLVSVGPQVTPLLKKAVTDRGFIGRGAALEALSRIAAMTTAFTFTDGKSHYRQPTEVDSIAGVNELGTSFVNASWRWRSRAHAQYVALEANAHADGVLLLQTWDASAKAMVVELYAFRDGEMKRLRATKQGAAFTLDGPSVVTGLEQQQADVVMHRLLRRTSSRQVEAGRVADPAVGMDVKLKGYEPHGKIVREDGGLWVVRVDKPIEGMTELTVADSALLGLKTEQVTESQLETIKGSVTADGFVIDSVDQAKAEHTSIAKMRAFTDDMCGCTDAACARRVSDEMTAWSKEMSQEMSRIELSKAEQSDATAIGQRMGDCMRRALSAD